MKRSFLLFATIIFVLGAKAQNVEISGQIIDKETQEAVPYVHIINTTTNQGTVSNTEGRFWVTIDKSDTLNFSAIGFETYAFTIKENVTTDKLIITIELNTATMELAPVDVFAYRDEHALKRALIEMDMPLQKEDKLTIPGVKEAQKFNPPGSGGISMGGPLSAIAKVFSKEEKEKKMLKQYQQKYDYQKVLTSKYNEHVVMEITNLPKDKVEDFMEFCVLEDSFIYRATEYELTVVLNQCLVDFKKLEEE